ncbi:MAG: hypothetical protein ACTHU0_05605 [Kofleriaceae bacterium]
MSPRLTRIALRQARARAGDALFVALIALATMISASSIATAIAGAAGIAPATDDGSLACANLDAGHAPVSLAWFAACAIAAALAARVLATPEPR